MLWKRLVKTLDQSFHRGKTTWVNSNHPSFSLFPPSFTFLLRQTSCDQHPPLLRCSTRRVPRTLNRDPYSHCLSGVVASSKVHLRLRMSDGKDRGNQSRDPVSLQDQSFGKHPQGIVMHTDQDKKDYEQKKRTRTTS